MFINREQPRQNGSLGARSVRHLKVLLSGSVTRSAGTEIVADAKLLGIAFSTLDIPEREVHHAVASELDRRERECVCVRTREESERERES
jgi:hypothetical protein